MGDVLARFLKKSETTLIVPFFFAMAKVGEANSEV
jgi:hypothetical protein